MPIYKQNTFINLGSWVFKILMSEILYGPSYKVYIFGIKAWVLMGWLHVQNMENEINLKIYVGYLQFRAVILHEKV
jgi:hypothetical protein